MARIKYLILYTVTAVFIVFSGCTTYVSNVDNEPGRASVYSDASTSGPVQGAGIESQDIISMTDKMMRDMLTNPTLVNSSTPRRVIIDSAYFRNESTNQINLNLLTDRLRSGLIQSAGGRMIFVGRQYSNMVEEERALKEQGIVDSGTSTPAAKQMGADFRLAGRITSLDTVDRQLDSRFTQVVFEMVDLQTSAIVWSGQYSFKKTDEPDVFYR